MTPAIFLTYVAAAIAEIGGCFAFWAWLRLGRSMLWTIPGVTALIVFAWLLTFVDTPAAGRAVAAYGGIYVAAAVVWLTAVEGVRLDRFDVCGVGLCLAGATVILWPR